jgi:CubicO group peptidase (beta-lactamase class C family)
MNGLKLTKLLNALICLSLLLYLGVPATLMAQSNPAPVAEQTLDAIDAYLETQRKEFRIPGLALGIVQGDQVVHLKGFGIADPSGRPVTPQTPFILNSISKSFAALAVIQLVEQGKIELDAPVQRYLPWFQVAAPKGGNPLGAAASAQITVRQLLNQTSGLPASAAYADLASPAAYADTLEIRVRRLSATQLNRPVGSTFAYTDANYDVLGLIVQTVADQPYTAYVQQQILTPLAMAQSETTRPEVLPTDLATGYRSWFGFPVPFRQWYAHALLPSGDLISTAEDMTHYLIAQLNEGRYNDASLLSSQGIATLHQPAVREGESEKFYGMGWEVRPMNDLTVVRHDGTSANYYADVVLDPAGRWGVVVLLNFNSLNLYGGRLHALTGGVLSLLHDQTPPVLPAMHHPLVYPAMIMILVISGLLLLWMGRMTWAWRRWLRTQRPHGWQRVGAFGLPLLLPLAWALLLLLGIPQVLYPLSMLRINVPDFGYTVLVSGGLALGWSVVWSVLLLTPRPSRTPITSRVGSPVSAPLKP